MLCKIATNLISQAELCVIRTNASLNVLFSCKEKDHLVID